MDIIITIVISVLTGVIAGIYSGIVVARMSKFEEIRNQVKKIIMNIDFRYFTEKPEIIARKEISELLFLSSDFYALKHLCAGNQVNLLLKDITSVIHSPLNEFDQMNEVYSEWQNTCRSLKPAFRVILSLKPWV